MSLSEKVMARSKWTFDKANDAVDPSKFQKLCRNACFNWTGQDCWLNAPLSLMAGVLMFSNEQEGVDCDGDYAKALRQCVDELVEKARLSAPVNPFPKEQLVRDFFCEINYRHKPTGASRSQVSWGDAQQFLVSIIQKAICWKMLGIFACPRKKSRSCSLTLPDKVRSSIGLLGELAIRYGLKKECRCEGACVRDSEVVAAVSFTANGTELEETPSEYETLMCGSDQITYRLIGIMVTCGTHYMTAHLVPPGFYNIEEGHQPAKTSLPVGEWFLSPNDDGGCLELCTFDRVRRLLSENNLCAAIYKVAYVLPAMNLIPKHQV